MEIYNTGSGRLSRERDLSRFGIAFLETVCMEGVSVSYCDLRTSEE